MFIELVLAVTVSRIPFFVPAPNEPIATLDGQPILAGALFDKIRAELKYDGKREAEEMRQLRAGTVTPAEAREELEDLARSRYSMFSAALEEYLLNLLLEREARRAGTTVDGLFHQFDTLRDEPVTDADVQEFVRNRNLDPAKLSKEEMESIPDIVRMQRVYAARESYMKQLRHDANIEVFLVRPGIRFSPAEIRRSESAGNGPIVVTVVTDFECPYSKRRVADVHSWAEKNPDVTVTIKHLPLEHIHPYARRAAAASICAARQGKFWQYHDWLFDHQDELMGEDEEFEAGAQQLGLDMKVFSACLDTRETSSEIDADIAWAKALRLRGTPAFFVDGIEAREPSEFEPLIQERRFGRGGKH
jgi:hypothetical protein